MGDSGSSSSNQPSGSGLKEKEKISDMLQRLWIEEDEYDDLVLEDEEEAPI
jgi:hypothetical protein